MLMRKPLFNAKVNLSMPVNFAMALTTFPHPMRAVIA
jgi:hypothetical protein